MTLDQAFDARPLVLLGCGKMGGALLDGWLAAGAPGPSVQVIDPHPSDTLKAKMDQHGVRLVDTAPETAEAVVLAVKPQMMGEATPAIRRCAENGALILSIAAGTTIADIHALLGAGRPVIRAMPNTPVAVGRGISALIASPEATAAQSALAEALMAAVGEAVWLQAEAEIDAVTAVSGSGPAYVFHMIEALAAAGRAEGLPEGLAMRLARATVIGAGALAHASDAEAETLRVNVTSPGGTTAAGLGVLMDAEAGLEPLMRRTVAAAAARGRALGG